MGSIYFNVLNAMSIIGENAEDLERFVFTIPTNMTLGELAEELIESGAACTAEERIIFFKWADVHNGARVLPMKTPIGKLDIQHSDFLAYIVLNAKSLLGRNIKEFDHYEIMVAEDDILDEEIYSLVGVGVLSSGKERIILDRWMSGSNDTCELPKI